MSYNRTKPAFAPGGVSGLAGLCAIFEDERPYNTYGGKTYASQWHIRTLTAERYNNTSGKITLQKFAIVGVTTGTNGTFHITGNQSSHFEVGHVFSVYGNTGYNRPNADSGGAIPYIVTNVSYNSRSEKTEITVATINAATTADGYIYTGRIILSSGTYLIQARPTVYSSVATPNFGRLSERTGCTYASNGYLDSLGTIYTAPCPGTGASTNTNNHLLIDDVITVPVGSTYYIEIHHFASTTTTEAGQGNRMGIPGVAERYCRTIVSVLS